MSFSTKVKTELSRFKLRDKYAKLAELSALIRVSGTLKLAGLGKVDLIISTESKETGEMISKLFRQIFSIDVEIEIDSSDNLRKKAVHRLKIKDAKNILEELEIIIAEQGILNINEEIPVNLLRNSKCNNAYIRGCFLGCGSITDPEKSYYIQFILHSELYAYHLNEFFHSVGIKSKLINRKKNYIVYLKEGDSISNLLVLMGATNSMMEFEELRLKKQFNAKINRELNCDIHNMSRINDNYLKNKNFIDIIDKKMGIENLPKDLRDIAVLRLENEVDSLKELGSKVDPPLSKSGVNYRLKKIEKLALKLEEEEE